MTLVPTMQLRVFTRYIISPGLRMKETVLQQAFYDADGGSRLIWRDIPHEVEKTE